MKQNPYLPEGYRACPLPPLTQEEILQAISEETVVTCRVERCDLRHDLHVKLGDFEGIIPRNEAILPSLSGAEKEIAVLTLVGHSISCVIIALEHKANGTPQLILSRKKAQEQALAFLLTECPVGTVCRGRITRIESFGAFVDIGCGIPALLPLEYISVARITHPARRLHAGENILCVLKQIDEKQNRFTVSHKELLGTWLENAALFKPGETVTGRVRGIKEYGLFIELTPNLSGLADYREDLREDDAVSVYIKSITPQRMKIKLQILQRLHNPPADKKPAYYITDGIIRCWQYAPPNCEKPFPPVIFS